MESQPNRLKRAIHDLKQIDMDVLFPATPDADNHSTTEEDELLFELKGVVDELRTSIWCRLKRKAISDEETKRVVDYYRMRRVVKMLRQIRASEHVIQKAQGPVSNMQQIEASAEAAIQMHGLATQKLQ